MNEEECKYYLCSFEELQKKKLTSQVYDHYYALCHINTKTSAGWAVCKYTTSGTCPVVKGCQKWESEFGTTNLNRHIKSHETESAQKKYPRKLGEKAKKRIIKAAAKVAFRDLRPYSFAEGKGMKAFIRTVFKEGQDVAPGDNIDHEDYIPSPTAVRDNIGVLATEFRKKFGKGIEGLLNTGGGMTIDGVTMKVQEKHFYDLTLHYITFKSKKAFEKAQPTMRTQTLLLSESKHGDTVADIRRLLNSNLMKKYEFDLDFLTKSFTLVTDWAAVMPNIVGASVSPSICPLGERWMGCVVHQLNTAMKCALKFCENDPL